MQEITKIILSNRSCSFWCTYLSLTSFLKIKEVKEKFKEQFEMPSLKLEGEMLVPPQTTNYSLVGTAFDYLIRFILEYHNPQAITSSWVSEQVPEFLDKIKIIGDKEKGLEVISKLKNFTQEINDFAREQHKAFMDTGTVNGKLLHACLLLAQTDVIYRTGKPHKGYGEVEEGDMDDLFELMKTINIKDFVAKEYILLNPTFGEASNLVGGADADIIMDGVLIDIKTTKYLTFKREYFDQLIGYYILSKIGGIDGVKEKPEIKELGIYFSRQAKLVKFSVNEVIDDEKLDEFIEWFNDKASFYFPQK